jgi:hypothetical protein
MKNNTRDASAQKRIPKALRLGVWLTILSGQFIANSANATDWPQFMGPKGDGTSTEKGLVRSWSEQGPKVLWTMPVGRVTAERQSGTMRSISWTV